MFNKLYILLSLNDETIRLTTIICSLLSYLPVLFVTYFYRSKLKDWFKLDKVMIILAIIYFILYFILAQGHYKLWEMFIYILNDLFIIALLEELLFRGIILSELEKRFTFSKSVILTSTMFGICHAIKFLIILDFSVAIYLFVASFLMSLQLIYI